MNIVTEIELRDDGVTLRGLVLENSKLITLDTETFSIIHPSCSLAKRQSVCDVFRHFYTLKDYFLAFGKSGN